MFTRVAVASALVSAARVRAEGEALVTELAEEVLAWESWKVLPSPWETVFNRPSNRDVGSVTEHPIWDKYDLEVFPDSLETTREQDGFPPNIAMGRVLIKDSKKPTQPPPSYRMTGVGGEEVRHLNGMVNPSGHTTCWGWEKVRYGAMTTWLNYWASRNSDKIVVFHAAGTMLYAGCDENTIMYKYNEIVSNSVGSPTVVLAAEVSPPQDEMSWRYDISSDAVAARTAFLASVAGADLTTYADCNATVGYCDSPPKYRYASSAFIMGPAGDVAEMLSEMPYWSNSENRLVNEYFLSNTDKVALDYSGILVLSLNNMKLDANIPVTVVDNAGAKSFSNKATGTSVCFVHGAGNSHDALKVLAQQLTA
ncbi:unnamed protein product [Prorocentrum cordatum]|uniref:Uncharacterized protein n=1 Tax=Prorocentrum cordatum TaxID=2364126 RepID=A0ABN9T6B1_9DINO|nr:unnamed protein product [Polarella glacialis]